MLEHRLRHLGRPMAVDWSLPKNVYDKMHTKGTCSAKLERLASVKAPILVEKRAGIPGEILLHRTKGRVSEYEKELGVKLSIDVLYFLNFQHRLLLLATIATASSRIPSQ